jgi:hypothetical protein
VKDAQWIRRPGDINPVLRHDHLVKVFLSHCRVRHIPHWCNWFLETRQLLIGWFGEQTGLCLLSKIDWCLDNRPGAAAQPSPKGYEATMSQKKLYRYQQRRLQVQPLKEDTVTRYRDIAPGRHHSVPKRLVQLDGIYWERLRLVLCVEVAFAQVACAQVAPVARAHTLTHTRCVQLNLAQAESKSKVAATASKSSTVTKLNLCLPKTPLGCQKRPCCLCSKWAVVFRLPQILGI